MAGGAAASDPKGLSSTLILIDRAGRVDRVARGIALRAMTYLEDYIASEFSGRKVMLVASYEAAFARALEDQNHFDVIVAFNSKKRDDCPSLAKLRVTHWCVNLGRKGRVVIGNLPAITPYHEKWGNLAKAVAFFAQHGATLVHPRADLFPFQFSEIGERLDPGKQPSVGLYLTRRLMEAGIRPTLVGFTSKVTEHHDSHFEKRVLEKLHGEGHIDRIPRTGH